MNSLCLNLLHQIIKGTFKDHLVEWIQEYINTAACAILRANKSEGNTCTTCKDGGLDLLYIDLHGLGEAWDDKAKQISNLQDRTMKDVLDAVCFHSPSFSTHCIIITGRSLSSSMPMAGLCCSYMPWVQNWSAQVMQTLQLVYTSCLMSAWATKSSLPTLYTLEINSAQKLCSHTWIVFCQGVNIMQLLCLFGKMCMFMLSLIIIVSIIFLSLWSTTFPKSSLSTS